MDQDEKIREEKGYNDDDEDDIERPAQCKYISSHSLQLFWGEGKENTDSSSFDVITFLTAIEGFIIIVTGIDEEATEEEVIEKFADFGKVQNCHLNLDRRTGYVKGYALLEFSNVQEAKEAIKACKDGLTLMDKELKAGFAFVQPPPSVSNTNAGMGVRGTASRGKSIRHRSKSPDRR